MVRESIKYLGRSGKDRITGFSGVVESVSFDVYGCVQVILKPPVDKDGKLQDGGWFDIARIEFDDRPATMRVPAQFMDTVATEPGNYAHGPAQKPLQRRS